MNTITIKIEQLDKEPLATWSWQFIKIKQGGKTDEFGGFASNPLNCIKDALTVLGREYPPFTELHVTVTTN